MSEEQDIVERLRGKYKIGPNGIYGTRDFGGFTPPVCSEAADLIDILRKENKGLKDAIEALKHAIETLPIKVEPLGADFEKILNDNLWDLYD
jgi:hypothetical protein